MGKKRTFNRPQRHQTEISVASVHGQAPRLPESCPENGNLLKLALLTIGSPVPSVAIGPMAMSALGHKRTFAVQKGMSALPPKATLNAFIRMSAKGQ